MEYKKAGCPAFFVSGKREIHRHNRTQIGKEKAEAGKKKV